MYKYDIVFLYETWTSSKSDISVKGYISHNFYRKFKHRKAKRCSGGIAVYFKESIKDGISVVKNNLNTSIWVKLDKAYFSLEQDVFLCGIYL